MREVRLEMKPSGFWLRLHVQVAASRSRILGAAAAGLILPTLLLLVMLVSPGRLFGMSHAEIFAVAVALNVGLCVATAMLVLVVKSISPSPLEQLLPRAVMFRVHGLHIVPREGAPHEATWGWIGRAHEGGGGIDLVIGERPALVLHIAPTTIGEEDFEQMRIWLERHGKLQGPRAA
jgi:hypothetical protein